METPVAAAARETPWMRVAPGPLRTAGYARGELHGARVDHSRPLSSGRGPGVALTPGVVSVVDSLREDGGPCLATAGLFPSSPRLVSGRPPSQGSLPVPALSFCLQRDENGLSVLK